MSFVLQPSSRLRLVSVFFPEASVFYLMELDRCLQTAEPAARALDLPIYVEHGAYCTPAYLCLRAAHH